MPTNPCLSKQVDLVRTYALTTFYELMAGADAIATLIATVEDRP